MDATFRLGTRVALGAAVVAISLLVASCGSSKIASSSVSVQISSPQDGGSVQADRVTVRGTVTPADAAVQILGQPAQVGNGVFTRSVPLHRGANTIDVVASAAGSAPATTTITVNRSGLGQPKNNVQAKGVPPLSGPSDCGNGLTAGAHTSCPFAENVRAAYETSGSGIVDVYSPTTGQTYRMYCTSGSPHVCTGGNGASVYFSSHGPVVYNTSDCGGGLLVGPATSCAFAENVRAEFNLSGSGRISVYSPVTSRTYKMFCTDSSPHVCTGGNNAAVYFP
jgi:Glucodextranase, domain B